MNYPNSNAHPAPENSKSDGYALFACGLWLHLGTIGAFGLAGVLNQLFTGEMQPLSGLALTAGAGVLVVMSWWRARVVLGLDDEADVATAEVSSPAKAVMGGSVA